MIPVNYYAVLAAAIANFIIGFLFHGPVFGKTWMRLANVKMTGNEKLSDMVPQMVKNFIVNIIFAYVLAVIIMAVATYYNNVGNIIGAMGIAVWVWLGFIVTSSSIDVIWMGKSRKLWMFEMVSSLVCLLAMGAIIGAWQ
jgi:hypothetical protein